MVELLGVIEAIETSSNWGRDSYDIKRTCLRRK